MRIIQGPVSRVSFRRRFLTYTVMVSLITLTLGWSVGTEAQGFQGSHPLASEGSASQKGSAGGNYLLGSDLRRIVARMRPPNPFRAPQPSGASGTAHHGGHAGLLALAGIGMVALGVWGFSSGFGQSCKTQKDLYGNTGTCGEDKVYGALFVAGGGAMLAAAAYESSSSTGQNANLHKAKKTKRSSASAASSGPISFPSSPTVTTANTGDIASAQNAINQIENEPHTQAPPVQAIGSDYGGATSITIQNSTPDLLTVYLAGPTGVTITVFSQSSQSVQVIPGSYRVGGRVSDTSVLPFLGYANFAGGSRYQETFYISTVPQ